MKTALCLLAALCLVVSCQEGVESEDSGLRNWDKPKWIADALKAVSSGRWPRVKALCYWHERWRNNDGLISDLRIDSTPQSKSAYQTNAKHAYFVTEPSYLMWGGFMRLDPPEKGAYLAAFPGFGSTEDSVSEATVRDFESVAGHKVTWAYFSDNWYHAIQFPSIAVAKLRTLGRTPFIRMMMRSEDNKLPDSKYRLQQIVDGIYDNDIRKWAQEAKLTFLPMMVEFGTEANGDWFPWNGRWNGGGTNTEFGDPTLPDGPARFRAAFRHIVDIFRAAEAYNVTWAYHANATSSPREAWNTISAYYPGDDYVDWIGLSVYGPQRPNEPMGGSFQSILDSVYPELISLSPDKPIAILEWGISEPSRSADDDFREVTVR